MSCYMRHMTWLFEALDLPQDKDHRKLLDREIRSDLELPDEYHCPEVWARIKTLDDDERNDLAAGLQQRLGSR
jgi:hypothetical protein